MFAEHGVHHDKIEDENEFNFRRLDTVTKSLSEKIDKINLYFTTKQSEPDRMQMIIDDQSKRLYERIR
jgi:hypothetical protein